MDYIRGLRVQVEPGTISEATLLPFALPPVSKELSIAELGELIDEKFERIHKHKGCVAPSLYLIASRADSAGRFCRKLGIKYLKDGYDTLLDQADSVGDYFVDRIGGTARIEDFTVHVHRLPPEPAAEVELVHSARNESVAPNSSARYLKRPRQSLPKDAAVARYANGYGAEEREVTHKRQRLNYGAFGDVLEQRDRPIISQERDSESSVHLVENSQRSPRTNRRSCKYSTLGTYTADIITESYTYAVPTSFYPSPHTLLSSYQVSQIIPDSQPSRGALPSHDITLPSSYNRAETPKSEPSEPENLVHNVPPSNPSTPQTSVVERIGKQQGLFRKPLLPPPRTKTPAHQLSNGLRNPAVIVTPQHTTPEGQTGHSTSSGQLRRPTSTPGGPLSEGSSGSKTFARRKPKDIWEPEEIESDDEPAQGVVHSRSAKRAKEHHHLNSEANPTETHRDPTGSLERSDEHAIKFAQTILDPLTSDRASERGHTPRSALCYEKRTAADQEASLPKLEYQNGKRPVASSQAPINDQQRENIMGEPTTPIELVDTGFKVTKQGDNSSIGEGSSTRSISEKNRSISRGRSLDSTNSAAIAPGTDMRENHEQGSRVHKEVLEPETRAAPKRATEAEEEKKEDTGDDDTEDEDEESESESEASEPEPAAMKTPAKKAPASKPPAQKSPNDIEAEGAQKPLEAISRRKDVAAEQKARKDLAEKSRAETAEQRTSQEMPVDLRTFEQEKLQVDGGKNSARMRSETPQLKTLGVKKPKSSLKTSSTPPFPHGKPASNLLPNRSGSISPRGTPARGVEHKQAQTNAAGSSPTSIRRSVSIPDEEAKIFAPLSSEAKIPKTPAVPRNQCNVSKAVEPVSAKMKQQKFREELLRSMAERKNQTTLQFDRAKGKEVVHDPPSALLPAPSETPMVVDKSATLTNSPNISSGGEPSASGGRGDSKTPIVKPGPTISPKPIAVLDQGNGQTEEAKLIGEETDVETEKQPTVLVTSAHGKSLSRSPARVVTPSTSSSSASETESETESESESESENGENKADEERRPASSTSQEAASGTSMVIGKSASPSGSSSSESESDDGDLPPTKRSSRHATSKSRSLSVGDEAARQLQREARESLEPSRSSQLKSSMKTPMTSKTLATVSEGPSRVGAKREAPANTRFPSLTALRNNSSSLPSSSAKRLPSYKMPLKASSGQKSSGAQVDGGAKFNETSSDEDSSTTDDEDEEANDVGKAAGGGGSQRRAGRGLGGLMKRKFASAHHVSLLTHKAQLPESSIERDNPSTFRVCLYM